MPMLIISSESSTGLMIQKAGNDMFHTNVRCPHCGHEFTYSIFRFNSTVCCEKCQKKIYIETKTSMYMILFVVFLLASDYIKAFLHTILPNQAAFLYFGLMFFIILISLLLVMFVLIKLFGFTSVYRIRDDVYYREAVQRANDRKKGKKK